MKGIMEFLEEKGSLPKTEEPQLTEEEIFLEDADSSELDFDEIEQIPDEIDHELAHDENLSSEFLKAIRTRRF